jgi:hypothetical protein
MADQNLNINIKANDKFSREAQQISSNMKNMGQSVKMTWVDVAAKIYIVQTAFRQLSRVYKTVVEAAQREQDAIHRLTIALEIQGEVTDRVSLKYQSMARSIQQSTRYGNEAVLEAMQTLISVGNVTEENMTRAIKATLDFATATGRDLNTAALTVAKAAAGFTGELSRYGIIIDENIPQTEKFAAALDYINKRFGGAAQKDINTYSGAVSQLNNAWGDMLETLGGVFTGSEMVRKGINLTKSAVENLDASLQNLAKNPWALAFVNPTSIGGFLTPNKNSKKAADDQKAQFDEFEKAAKDAAKTYENAMKASSSTVAKTIKSDVETAKTAFDSFTTSIQTSFQRMVNAMQSAIEGDNGGFFKTFMAAFAGNLLTGAGNWMANTGGNWLTSAGSASLAKMTGNPAALGPAYQLGTSMVGKTGLAVVHKGEEIRPAYRVREQSGGNVININMLVKSWDAQDVYRNRKMLAGAIAQELKNNGEIRKVMKTNG